MNRVVIGVRFQTCRLGKHRPLVKLSRDGIVRVGEDTEAEKLEELDVDQWLTGPWAGQQHTDNLNKLKLYAYACKQQLGKIESRLTYFSGCFLLLDEYFFLIFRLTHNGGNRCDVPKNRSFSFLL